MTQLNSLQGLPIATEYPVSSWTSPSFSLGSPPGNLPAAPSPQALLLLSSVATSPLQPTLPTSSFHNPARAQSTPAKGPPVKEASDPGPARPSPKIPGSLLACGSSLVFFGCLLFSGLTARGARTGLGLALKKVTMKGCLERGARCPSRPARPGSTLWPEREERGSLTDPGGTLLLSSSQRLRTQGDPLSLSFLT